MKKILVIILIILVLIFLVCVYALIPQKISVVTIRPVYCTLNGAERMILQINRWTAWWPNQGSIQMKSPGNVSPTFIFRDKEYKPGITSINSLEIDIAKEKTLTKTELMILPLSKDSVELEWLCKEIATSANPLTRIQQYLHARDIKNDLDAILNQLESYLSKKENIYGIHVNATTVKDSVLISTKFMSSSFPVTTEIYSAITTLRKYIAQQKATETNFPMMHVDRIDSNHFETMIAIPVNKELHETNDIKTKRMVLGNIVESDIKGGQETVQTAMQELENYRKDYGLQSPAIPFASLVTDRSKEPDTSKWITKIYYPVY